MGVEKPFIISELTRLLHCVEISIVSPVYRVSRNYIGKRGVLTVMSFVDFS